METITIAGKKAKFEPVASNLELVGLLACRNVDITRFDPVGAEFYQLFENCYNAAIVCVDRKKFMENKPYLVKIVLEDLTHEEYSRFHKKFGAVIAAEKKNYYSLNFSDVLMQSEVTINLISNGKFAT